MYGNVSLGINSLGKMVQVISKRLRVFKNFTNHSVRSTAITVLSDSGIEARHIAKVSGHRSLLSIDNYARDSSEDQKRNFSAILQNTALNAHQLVQLTTRLIIAVNLVLVLIQHVLHKFN